ncbi:hydrolase [Neptunicella sp. SCSIO 80796]|uniref:hydrolase n=1 Tax=Neptunicella plasticusilytica TaxID=3117012 RepID=UPI003A4E1B8C
MTQQSHGKIITSPFKPAWWAKNRHIQTIWPRYLQRRQKVSLTSQRLELPDGDFVDLSWTPKPTNSKGIAVLFHGLEGSARSHYARDMLAVMAQKGWHAVLMHFRGCSDSPNRLQRAYHSGDTGDALYLLKWLSEKYPSTHLVTLGFSLGANMLLKLLGENRGSRLVDAAVCVSPPFKLAECSSAVNMGFSKNYQKYLLNSMVRKLKQKMSFMDYSQHLSILSNDINKLRTFRDFDEQVTSKLHGFKDANDYYQQCSAVAYTRQIDTPTLVIHAKDDPFMNEKVIPTENELSDKITVELSEHGGHVGFLQGTPWCPKVWLHRRVPEYFDDILNNKVTA